MQFYHGRTWFGVNRRNDCKNCLEKVIRRGNKKTFGDATVKTILAISVILRTSHALTCSKIWAKDHSN